MADSNQTATATQSGGSKVKYFRTNIAGLSVVTEPPENVGPGESSPHTVRFTPIWQRWDGEMQKFGYLKTDNEVAIEKCLNDPNVVEVDADEYKKVLADASDGNKPNVRLAAT